MSEDYQNDKQISRIQYQQRSNTMSDWELFESLPQMIDVASLTDEQYLVMQEKIMRIQYLKRLCGRSYELKQILLSSQNINRDEIEKTQKSVADTDDEIRKKRQELLDFEDRHREEIRFLNEIGGAIVDDQERERDRILLEEWRRKKYGISSNTPTSSSQKHTIQNKDFSPTVHQTPKENTPTSTSAQKKTEEMQAHLGTTEKENKKKFQKKYNRIRIIALCISLLFWILFSVFLIRCFFTREVVYYKEYTETSRIKTYVCYVTATGECYHSLNCQYLKNSAYKTTVYEAKLDGYLSCSKCTPRQSITIRVEELKEKPVLKTEVNYVAPIIIGFAVSVALYNFGVYKSRQKYNQSLSQ